MALHHRRFLVGLVLALCVGLALGGSVGTPIPLTLPVDAPVGDVGGMDSDPKAPGGAFDDDDDEDDEPPDGSVALERRRRPRSTYLMGPATLTCTETCQMNGLSCYDAKQRRMNKDVDYCLYKIDYRADVEGNIVRGAEDHTYSMFPTGCYANYRWSAYRVSVNSNTFGTDEFGCDAPSAAIQFVYRVCACHADGGGRAHPGV